MLIYATDFDGCLFEDKFPMIGKVNLPLLRFLKERRMNGDKIILWTVRTGKYLESAVTMCKAWGLEFDAVNEDIEEIKKAWPVRGPKVYADVYIDDKAMNWQYRTERNGNGKTIYELAETCKKAPEKRADVGNVKASKKYKCNNRAKVRKS